MRGIRNPISSRFGLPPATADDPNTVQNDIGALSSPALISAGVNFATQKADGIDVEVSYRRTFDNGHRLNLRGVATTLSGATTSSIRSITDFQDRILSELGDPVWAAVMNIAYGIGPWDLRYTANYLGRQTIATYERRSDRGESAAPTNADDTAEIYYPDVLYHNARLSYRVNERFQFYAGVDTFSILDP